MKKIGIMIPTYNEELNIEPLIIELVKMFAMDLPDFDYEILCIDNYSTDHTREILKRISKENKKVKVIFNAKNFGAVRSVVHGLRQSDGDCTIQLAADFQDPVELIPSLVAKWVEGYKIVVAKKTKSKENPLMYLVRSIYYKFIGKLADIEHIEHFTGFGLYDRSFISVLRELDDPYPYLRGIVVELGCQRAEVPFEQPRRRAGKTSTNWYSLYDQAMLGITSYSRMIPRMATILGFVISGVSFLVALVYLVLKIIYWADMPLGFAPMTIGMFFMGSVQLLFLGFIGEYVMSINTRVLKRPLVIEECRLNFVQEESEEDVL